MHQRQNKNFPMIFLVLSLLAAVGWPAPAQAEPPIPPTRSPRLERSADWAGSAFLANSILPAEGEQPYSAAEALDLAEHLEPLPNTADAFATTYTARIQGLVTDNRGQPLPDRTIIVAPAALNIETIQTDPAGRFTTYHAGNSLHTFEVADPQGMDGSPAAVLVNQDRDLHIVLSPRTNLLTNGSFESNLTGWQTSGTVAMEPVGHSGQAVRLGVTCPPPCQTLKEEFVETYNPSLNLVVDSQNHAHLLVNGVDYWLRDAQGKWSHPDQPYGIPRDLLTVVTRLDNQDTLHVLYGTQYGIFYVQKPKAGNWINMEYVDYYTDFYSYPESGWMDIDQQGRVHVVYPDHAVQYRRYVYVRRGLDGRWSQPLKLPGAPDALAAASDGGAYLFAGLQMQHVSPTGVLETAISTDGCAVIKAQADHQGQVQALCAGTPYSYRILDAAGYWKTDHFWSTFTPWGSFFSRDGSAVFYSKEDYYDANIQVMIKQPNSDEFEYYDYNTGQHAIERDELSMAVSLQSGLHIANSGISSAFYSKSQVTSQPAVSGVSQAVTIPANLYQPTLSFLYKLEGPARTASSGITVTLTTQDNCVIDLYNGNTFGTWQHGWADLSPWAGQTVTINFQHGQAAGEARSSLLLDEISLGMWDTPVIESVSPNQILELGEGDMQVTIRGNNFRTGAVVRLENQDIASNVISQTELSFILPGIALPGVRQLQVVNPSGSQSNTARILNGHAIYLPVTRK